MGVTPIDLDARVIDRDGRLGAEVETISFETGNELFKLR